MKTSTLLLTYGALVTLLSLTVGVALLPISAMPKAVAGLALAATKAALIAGFFMHLRNRSGLVRIFSVAGLFWLLLLFLLTATDYLTRGWK